MKKIRVTSIITCLIGSLFMSFHANFAGPPNRPANNQIREGASSGSFNNLFGGETQRSESKHYLASRIVPEVDIDQSMSLYRSSDPDKIDRPAFLGETDDEPTLKGFLAALEAERIAEEQASRESNSDQGEASDQDEVLEPEEAASDMSAASDKSSESILNESSSNIILTTTVPQTIGPIFPRPRQRQVFNERFFVYFPVDKEAGQAVEILATGSSEAIFAPPVVQPSLGSSATLREGD